MKWLFFTSELGKSVQTEQIGRHRARRLNQIADTASTEPAAVEEGEAHRNEQRHRTRITQFDRGNKLVGVGLPVLIAILKIALDISSEVSSAVSSEEKNVNTTAVNTAEKVTIYSLLALLSVLQFFLHHMRDNRIYDLTHEEPSPEEELESNITP